MKHSLTYTRRSTKSPFEPEHQFAASYHSMDGSVQIFVKGAPERVSKMCQDTTAANTLDAVHLAAECLAEKGCRVLALATGRLNEEPDLVQSPPIPSSLTLIGVVGMIDPLRPGVIQAIGACDDAGMTASMVTGDHPTTASTIGYELGLAKKGRSGHQRQRTRKCFRRSARAVRVPGAYFCEGNTAPKIADRAGLTTAWPFRGGDR